jgi:hypothetical protein
MAPRHRVAQLNQAEFDFVLTQILNGATDRAISAAFEAEFRRPLAKSSLNRWRKSAGDELADRFRIARFQALSLKQELKSGQGSYDALITDIEDRLLVSAREALREDPHKLLAALQEERRQEIQRRKLELERERLELERRKIESQARTPQDAATIALEALLDVAGGEQAALNWIHRSAEALEAALMKRFEA